MKWKKLVQILIILTPVLFLFCEGYIHRWNSEDAFISFRVVDNLISGYGPVYNIDERVEAYTHPLWVAILSLSAIITKSIELSAVWLGLTFSCLGLLFGIIGGIKIIKNERNSLHIPLGAFVIASLPTFWDFATSGLETGLAFLWLGVSFFLWIYFLEKPKKLNFVLLWFSLGTLIRPDLGIFWVGFMIVTIIILAFFHQEKIDLRRILKFLIFSFLFPLFYQIFRMGYFASIFPNPTFAKEAFKLNMRQGLIYLWDFISPYALYIPTILCILIILAYKSLRISRKESIVYTSFFILGLFHITYVVFIGGDFMHGRFLLPSFFSIFISIPSIPLNKTHFYNFLIGSAVTWCIICGILLRIPYKNTNRYGITNERAHYIACASIRNPVKIVDYKKCGLYGLGMNARVKAIRSKKRSFLYHENIGISGFVAGSKVHVFDMLGLADPIASRFYIDKRGRPGHEKYMPLEWILARIEENSDNMKVNYAKRAMECGDLSEYLESIRGKLTLKKFTRNILVALKTFKMRIPMEPFEAMQKFCGDQKIGIQNPKYER